MLTASLIGAGHVLNSHAAATDSANKDGKVGAERSFADSPGVICLGTVEQEDAPGGAVPLAPLQSGEVIDIPAKENHEVRKGDVLLRIDDALQANAVAQAEDGVRAAQDQVTEAQQGVTAYQAGIDSQKAAVEAAKYKIKGAEFRLSHQRALLELTAPQSNKDEINASTADLNAAKSNVAAEEDKLRAIQANKPDIKVQLAQDGLARARKSVDQARLLLGHCTLTAPADGLVLRISVTKGSILGPTTRQAPILFAPTGPRIVRAEVEQEFAHRVQASMSAVITDEANSQVTWQGRVKRLGSAYLPKRSAAGMESLSLAGRKPRVLECIVELEPGQQLPLLGQRVRVNIGTHGGS